MRMWTIFFFCLYFCWQCISYHCIPSNILLLMYFWMCVCVCACLEKRNGSSVYIQHGNCIIIIWVKHGTDRYIRFVIKERVQLPQPVHTTRMASKQTTTKKQAKRHRHTHQQSHPQNSKWISSSKYYRNSSYNIDFVQFSFAFSIVYISFSFPLPSFALSPSLTSSFSLSHSLLLSLSRALFLLCFNRSIIHLMKKRR